MGTGLVLRAINARDILPKVKIAIILRSVRQSRICTVLNSPSLIDQCLEKFPKG